MERFDEELALRYIEQYDITVSQWVPTMFVRMLKLEEEARHRHDLSRHKRAIHAAAPCPVVVKRRMIEWWGPILLEYYAGTEGNGGRRDRGRERGRRLLRARPRDPTLRVPQREEKTVGSRNPRNERWTTLGDVGFVDEDGFLFLTDRKAFMIISGGVNIYSQEIENALAMHPKVADVAVIGVPNEEMGEEVKAVVQLREPLSAGEEIAQELIAYSREQLAGYKVPRSVDFEEEMPRLPTGKLYKRLLRDRYWGNHGSRIV